MEKVKVKMSKVAMGSEHGNITVKFEAGKEYTIMKELAKVFVDEMGCAVYTHEFAVLNKPEPVIIRRKVDPIYPVEKIQPSEPVEKIKPEETVEKQKDQPGEIVVGDSVRNKKTGKELTITKLHYGWITFDNGQSIRSGQFKKDWEIIQ